MDQHTTDRALLERIVAGEEHAFHELLARYRDRVYAIAYAGFMDPERAEAVVTATFEQARRTAEKFLASPGSVNAWLIDLANVCMRDGVGEAGR